MTAKEVLATIRKNYPYQEFGLFHTLEKALEELEELKANQMKVKTIEGYGIDDVLAVIQGFKSKEISPEILHSRLKMYKVGYENGIKAAQYFIKEAFGNLKKAGDKDE